MTYEAILEGVNANLIKATSAEEALTSLLKTEIAVILMDVCMPDLDGFELAAMIRNHPRHEKTAVIFISGVRLETDDLLKGYRTGAVDYVPVPVVPEILKAKVQIFVELYRKSRQLDSLNAELEERVKQRTEQLEDSHLSCSKAKSACGLPAKRRGSRPSSTIWSNASCSGRRIFRKSCMSAFRNAKSSTPSST